MAVSKMLPSKSRRFDSSFGTKRPSIADPGCRTSLGWFHCDNPVWPYAAPCTRAECCCAVCRQNDWDFTNALLVNVIFLCLGGPWLHQVCFPERQTVTKPL
jgi:hypothetical protein